MLLKSRNSPLIPVMLLNGVQRHPRFDYIDWVIFTLRKVEVLTSGAGDINHSRRLNAEPGRIRIHGKANQNEITCFDANQMLN